jgi:hypothetical protein
LSSLFYSFNIFFHTFLTAKIEDFAGNFFLHSRSFGDISLAIGVLDKFLRLRLTVHSFSQEEHIFDKKAKDIEEDD